MGIKKLSYRQAKKGMAEQYGINFSKKILSDMGICPENREVQIDYDKGKKIIRIRPINK